MESDGDEKDVYDKSRQYQQGEIDGMVGLLCKYLKTNHLISLGSCSCMWSMNFRFHTA